MPTREQEHVAVPVELLAEANEQMLAAANVIRRGRITIMVLGAYVFTDVAWHIVLKVFPR